MIRDIAFRTKRPRAETLLDLTETFTIIAIWIPYLKGVSAESYNAAIDFIHEEASIVKAFIHSWILNSQLVLRTAL